MSLKFDGLSEYIDLPTAVVSGNDFSMLWWAQATFSGLGLTDVRMIGTEDAQGANHEIRQYGASPVKSYLGNGVTAVFVEHGSPSDDVWTHFALTWDYDGSTDTTVNGYMNCVLGTSDTIAGTIVNPDTDVWIARWGGDYFTGIIGEVSFWNRCLSLVEIKSYMHKSLAGSEENLVGYWPINDAGVGTSVPIKDISGNGQGGSMEGFSGSPWMSNSPVHVGLSL